MATIADAYIQIIPSAEGISGNLSNILNNEAQNGAGAYLNGGILNLTGGSFTQNNATNNGAGAFVNTGNIEMSGGSFDGNIALINGGGAYLAG